MDQEIKLNFQEVSAAHLELERILNDFCAVPYAGCGIDSNSKAMDSFLDRFDEVRQVIRDYTKMLERDLDAISDALLQAKGTDEALAHAFETERNQIQSAREYAPDPLLESVDAEPTGKEFIAAQKEKELKFAQKGAHFGL